jgi:hypothetical protein
MRKRFVSLMVALVALGGQDSRQGPPSSVFRVGRGGWWMSINSAL